MTNDDTYNAQAHEQQPLPNPVVSSPPAYHVAASVAWDQASGRARNQQRS